VLKACTVKCDQEQDLQKTSNKGIRSTEDTKTAQKLKETIIIKLYKGIKESTNKQTTRETKSATAQAKGRLKNCRQLQARPS